MELNTGNTVIKLKTANPDTKVSEFISCLMTAANITHKMHLKTTGVGSYATHSALNELYDALPGFADDIAEKFQGYNQRLLPVTAGMNEASFLNMEPVAFTKWLLNYVETNRSVFGSNSMIQNIVDELIASISKTLYKLTFLS